MLWIRTPKAAPWGSGSPSQQDPSPPWGARPALNARQGPCPPASSSFHVARAALLGWRPHPRPPPELQLSLSPLQGCSSTSAMESGTARRTCGSPGPSASAPAMSYSPAAAWRRGCRPSSPAPSPPRGCRTPTPMTPRDDTWGDGGTWPRGHLRSSPWQDQTCPPPPGPFNSGALGLSRVHGSIQR